VGYTPLDYDYFKGSRDTMAEDDDSTSSNEDFTSTDERAILPQGLSSTQDRSHLWVTYSRPTT